MTCRSFAPFAAFALVAAACADQGTVVVTASLPSDALNWNKTLTVPQFNNPYVTLDSVDIAFTGGVSGSMKFENRDPISRSYSGKVTNELDLSSPTGAALLTVRPPNFTASGTLKPFDGTLDYDGDSGKSYTQDPISASGSATLTGSDLAPFIGSGTVGLPVAASVTTSLTTPGNFSTQVRSSASADITLTYHYSFTPASLGDRVWQDKNGNGIQDDGEPGVSGVTVQLLDGSGNPVLDGNGQPITTTTGANGIYGFSGLMPGEYMVKFVAPAGTSFTTQGWGTATDSDADVTTGLTAKIVLHSGDARTDIDAGLVGLQSVGDFVWLDADGDGIQEDGEPGIQNINVSLLDSTNTVVATMKTDVNGKYEFDGLMPGSYKVQFDAIGGYTRTTQSAGSDRAKDSDADATSGLTATFTLNAGDHRTDIDAGYKGSLMLGDRVWFDANANGIQDDGENGIKNVTVHLLKADGTPVLDSSGNPVIDVTDENGNYLFTDLLPGNYRVKVDAPSGYTFTGRQAGNDVNVDSDVDGSGRTDVVALTQDNLSVDAGLYGTLCLGDRVWKDLDKDGLQDSCEPGIPGVKVHLIDAGGTDILDTVTDKNGYYKFQNLVPGDYTVQFDAPDGYGFTKLTSDTRYRASDSNADPATGKAAVTLVSNDATVDAGLIGALKIGDTVWLDCDGDGIFDSDQGEKGLKNVRVYLYANGNYNNAIASTVTDANGHYLFMGLQPGTYVVRVEKNDLPAGSTQTNHYGTTTPYYGLGSVTTADNLYFDFGFKPYTPSKGCTHKWWCCNTNCWSWDCLWIGNKCHTRTTVCAWMKRDDCGDKSICMYQRLCAAKLNVGSGCNESKVYTCGRTSCTLKDAIRRADAWMCNHPVGCNVSERSNDWQSICDVFNILDAHCNGK